METRTITLAVVGCCGNGANVRRSVTREQYNYLALLANDLSKNDGYSTPFTVPFFYISDWDGKDKI